MQLNLLEFLEHSATLLPDKTAFSDQDGFFTFETLLKSAKKIGSEVARHMHCNNRPVVIFANRDIKTIAMLQGVLMSGNYYVPLEAKMPESRMAKILEGIDPEVILCPDEYVTYAASFSFESKVISFTQALNGNIDNEMLDTIRAQVLDIDPAYMIFTSGSTGAPKGIVVSHRAVIDFCDWMADFCGLVESDIFANQAPFYFDLSVKDIYMTLKCGATCEIVPQKNFLFPLLLFEYLDEKNVTALLWATTAFHLAASSGALSEFVPKKIRLAAIGGEALGAKQVNIWKKAIPKMQIINLYGPTEATVDCTGYKLDREYADTEVIPIGSACNNKQILLLDENLRPVPDGQPGELCVRGTGLATGYYRDKEKTAYAFIQNPLNTDYPDIIYRTGDIAYRGSDGLYRFMSRKDGQIKHMGYRIELGEIEAALNGLTEISSAVCLYDDKRKRIYCIYSGIVDSNDIAKRMRNLLPKYMLPNMYRRLDKLPLNANGKIDRVLLKSELIHDKD